ncbi:MAG: hypothetical protein HLUCCO16_05150 [Phormidium sp. OSCR]|nr:MAG: hypothetical protein HLUCCO16_05150 [Phormidium sp. OSCR]
MLGYNQELKSSNIAISVKILFERKSLDLKDLREQKMSLFNCLE